MEVLINKTRVVVQVGELALQEVDALIHPTNNFLWFSSGYSENLKRIGGGSIETEALERGPIQVGQAVVTSAGRLKSRYLINAAAWGQDMRPEIMQIRAAVAAALRLASEHHCLSVALPPVGAGVGEFSLRLAVESTFFPIVEHCWQSTYLQKIIFLARDHTEEEILNRVVQSAAAANPSEPDHHS
jgi:O-acetyl-ADP-ribose deacetylase (regulator of RNase III)